MRKRELFFWGTATFLTSGAILLAALLLKGVVKIARGASVGDCSEINSQHDELTASMVLDCEMPAPAAAISEDMPLASELIR